jgi:hypothetical protein
MSEEIRMIGTGPTDKQLIQHLDDFRGELRSASSPQIYRD